MKNAWIAMALCAAALALTGCGRREEVKPPAPPTKLKIVILPRLSYAPIYIGQEEGYFAEQNVELEYVRMAHATTGLPALAQGDLDILGGFVSAGLLNMIARGAQVRIVADKGSSVPGGCDYLTLLVRREVAEKGLLDTPESLRSLRFAGSDDQTSSFYMDRMLAQHGISVDEISLRFIPMETRAEALKTDAWDVSTSTEPWTTRMRRTGKVVEWKAGSAVLPSYQLGYLAFGPSLLKDNPDAGRRFMVAYVKSVRQYNLGKTERNVAILAKHTQLDADLIEEACWVGIHGDGRFDPAGLVDFQNWAAARGSLDALLEPQQYYDPSFADYANNVLDAAPKEGSRTP